MQSISDRIKEKNVRSLAAQKEIVEERLIRKKEDDDRLCPAVENKEDRLKILSGKIRERFEKFDASRNTKNMRIIKDMHKQKQVRASINRERFLRDTTQRAWLL